MQIRAAEISDIIREQIRDYEKSLEVPDLHRQCRLGDRAGVGGSAEMAVLGKRIEIAQLAQGEHW